MASDFDELIKKTLQLPDYGHLVGSVSPMHNEACQQAAARYFFSHPQATDKTLLSRRYEVRIPEKDRLQHTYLLGATGVGKSELLKSLIYSYATRDMAAVIVIDPAGDFAKEIALWPEARHRTIYIHPTFAKGLTPTINPFEASGDIRVPAQQLLEAFQEVLGDGQGAEMSLTMRAALMPCIMTLMQRPGSTFLDLQRFMEQDNHDLVELGLRSSFPAVASFFQSFANPRERRFDATKGSLANKVSLMLHSGHFQNLTCGTSTINLGKEIDQKKLIVFNLAKGDIGDQESRAFGRLVLALVLGHVLRRKRRVPTHLFIDECANYITPSIRTILLEARKFKLHLTLAQQFVGEGMSTDMRKVITGSCNIQITGYQQREHQADAAKLLGVSVQQVARLNKGQYIMSIGNRPAFMFRGLTHLLGMKHRMQKPTWNRFKARQLVRYYRPMEQPVREPVHEPEQEPEANPFDADMV